MNVPMSRPPGVPKDAWELFLAAADGDLPNVQRLVESDPEWMHYPIWYEFPLHFAVRSGHLEVVRFLLDAGTNPARSNFCYSSWQKLLPKAQHFGHVEIHALLVAEMRRRFNYDPACKPLFDLIGEKDDVAAACRMIDEHPEFIDAGDEHGNRALHWAVLSRRIPVIEKLIDAGADLQALRADLQSPLHLSVMKGDYWYNKSDRADAETSAKEVTDYLLERGAVYEFSVAVVRDDRERVETLIASCPGIATELNPSRRSPLGLAARNGRIEMVRLLLEHGAEPNLAEECCDQGAALFAACARNDVEMVKLLLEHGADPNAECDSSGCCLTIAAHRKNENTPEVHRLLREHGANDPLWALEKPEEILERLRIDDTLDPDDWYWGGILQRVLSFEDMDLLNAFIDRFGNEPIRKVDPANGWNAVDSPEFLDELIRLGLEVNQRDWRGQTYLHAAAAEDGKPAGVGLYLDRGLEIDAVDHRFGTTALGVASMHGNATMVKYLLERGADPRVPNGRSSLRPLALAKRGGKEEVIAVLQSHS